MPNDRPQAYQRVAELLIGARISMALRVAAECGLADLLVDGPKTAEALARETGFAADPLRRLVRALAGFGVFEETPDGRIGNTEMSDYLREDASPSLREMVLFLNNDVSLRAWLKLSDVLEAGEGAFEAANGAPLFKYIADDQELSAIFGRYMTGIYGPEAAKIAAGSFDRFENLIDVGGGRGHILAAILARHDGLRGAVFDLPPTAELARGFLQANGLSERCEVIDGDFFTAVPAGYDAYMLKSVLHDWNDAKAIQILRHCRAAMPAHGRLLVVEEVMVPGRPVGHPHQFVDLELMVTVGGKERTEQEYAALFGDAGFGLQDVTPVDGSFFSVIEAVPA